MRAFVPTGTKFSSKGMTWIAGPQNHRNQHTAIAMIVQVWKSKKTWLTITCRYDFARDTLTWEVSRYDTFRTIAGAASLAASQTRESLDAYADRLALYGDETEKRYARMILKKKKNVVIEDGKLEEVQW